MRGYRLRKVSLLRVAERGYGRVDGAELLEQSCAVVDEAGQLTAGQPTPVASLDEGDEL